MRTLRSIASSSTRRRTVLRACAALLVAAIGGPAAAQSIAAKVDYLGTPWYLTVSSLASRERNGLLSLSIEFSNAGRHDEEGFYRIAWFDADGFPVGGEEAWKPILLHGQQKQPIVTIAPTKEARDFKIQFSAQVNSAPPGSDGPRN